MIDVSIGHILFDLRVPVFRIKLLKPATEFSQFLKRKLLDSLFN